MLFNSLEFFIFISFYYTLIFFFKSKWKEISIIFSFIFYSYWNFWLTFLLYFIIFQSYFFSNKIYLKKNKILYLTCSISLSLICLFFFKYFNFFLEDILNYKKNNYFENTTYLHLISEKIILPLGISFYTFQSIGYCIDIYRNEHKPYDFKEYLLFISFFPQLIAGPILKAKQIIPQFNQKINFKIKNIKKSILLISWGFFLKICLADNISEYLELYYNVNNSNSTTILFSFFAFGFQIYGDFAGYSLIAIGICKSVNINIMKNFNLPYSSNSFKNFWERWHISLSNYIKSYLYIPLGGNKIKKRFQSIPILLSMTISGLWHGASFNFLIWGFLHGALIYIERIFGLEKNQNFFYKYIVILAIFLLWIPFVFDGFESIKIIKILLEFNSYSMNIQSKFNVVLIILNLIILIMTEKFLDLRKIVKILNNAYLFIFIVIVLINLIAMLGNFNEKNFIYFQF